jgi:hypothetical protein
MFSGGKFFVWRLNDNCDAAPIQTMPVLTTGKAIHFLTNIGDWDRFIGDK